MELACNRGDLTRVSALMESLVGPLYSVRESWQDLALNSGRLIEELQALVSQERFWESHEVLEGLWRALGSEELKRLIQAIASLVKVQEGALDDARRMLFKALYSGEQLFDWECFRYMQSLMLHGIYVGHQASSCIYWEELTIISWSA